MREAFDTAVFKLRNANSESYLAQGLIERARHHRWLNEPGDADAARQDLAEAQEIAAFSNMKLHLLDIRLEQAVWALREGRNARALLDETAELLAQTQCTRRALELKALKEIVR